MARSLSLSLVAGLLTSCFGPSLAPVECGQSQICPAGLVCDLASDVCVPPDDVAADAGSEVDAPVGVSDGDEDGVADDVDNCPAIANALQHDEDADGVGDRCDNCPATSNADQRDSGELDAGATADGVGDACDPRPSSEGDEILFFDGFSDGLEQWTVIRGEMTWAVADGKLIQESSAAGFSGLVWKDTVVGQATISTRARPLEVLPAQGGDPVRSVGVLGQYDPTATNQGRGYICTHYFDANAGPQTTSLIIATVLAGVVPAAETPTDPLAVGDAFDIALDVDGVASAQRCRTGASVVSNDSDRFTEGNIGLRTNGAAAEFDHVLIIGLGGPLEP